MNGGNNAVYFLLNKCEGTGCMKTSNFGEIIISVDKFSGKNNNRMMIWFIVKYLVDKKGKRFLGGRHKEGRSRRTDHDPTSL